MRKAFLVGGWKATKSRGFAPWLIEELQRRGFEAVFVQLPHCLLPTTKSGVKKLGRLAKDLPEGSILIAHSFGARVALKYLASEPAGVRFATTILIAPLYWWATPLKRWCWKWSDSLDVEAIKKHSGDVAVLHSEDDLLVPVENGRIIARQLEATYLELEKSGHFCPADDCYALPEVLPFVLPP